MYSVEVSIFLIIKGHMSEDNSGEKGISGRGKMSSPSWG